MRSHKTKYLHMQCNDCALDDRIGQLALVDREMHAAIQNTNSTGKFEPIYDVLWYCKDELAAAKNLVQFIKKHGAHKVKTEIDDN